MKQKLVIPLLLLSTSCTAAVAADTKNYITASDMTWAISKPSYYGQANSGRLVYGRALSDHFSWEGHLSSIGGQTGVSGDYIAAAFIRPKLSLWKVDLFVLVGAGVTNVGGVSRSSLSGGFGGLVNITDQFAIRADFQSYTSMSNWNLSGYNIGLNYSF